MGDGTGEQAQAAYPMASLIGYAILFMVPDPAGNVRGSGTGVMDRMCAAAFGAALVGAAGLAERLREQHLVSVWLARLSMNLVGGVGGDHTQRGQCSGLLCLLHGAASVAQVKQLHALSMGLASLLMGMVAFVDWIADFGIGTSLHTVLGFGEGDTRDTGNGGVSTVSIIVAAVVVVADCYMNAGWPAVAKGANPASMHSYKVARTPDDILFVRQLGSTAGLKCSSLGCYIARIGTRLRCNV
jgi:hypothetical protein